MNARIHFAAPLLLAAAGAIAATGFTSRTSETTSAAAPAKNAAIAPAASETAAAAPRAIDDSASAPAVRDTSVMPARQHRARVEITAPRPSDDELLRNVVMDRLSSDGRISGTVGVDAYRHTVSLTGRVMSTNQVERAEMIARGVDGVWDVNNGLHARVGQS